MAAPITHIVLTNKIFDKHFRDKDKKKFFIGTSFPDIRILKVINREKTHFKNINIGEIKAENSFLAGLKFHSLLDGIREKFIISKDIYSLYPKSKYTAEWPLKLLEDEILYNHVDNWSEFIDFLNEILPEETSFGIDEADIKKWHKILQKYFSQKPTNGFRNEVFRDLGHSKDFIDELNTGIDQMIADRKVIQAIEELYNNFDSLCII